MQILGVKCDYEGRTRPHVSYLKLLTRFLRNQVESYAAFPKYITLLLIIFKLSVISLSIHEKVLREKYAQSRYTYSQCIRHHAVS